MQLFKWVRFLYHRIRFRMLYREAAHRTEEVVTLAKYVGHHVHSMSRSYSGLNWMLFNEPGYHHETSPICWEAPIAILLHLNGKPAFGISLEVHRSRISIRQLHGVAGATIPRKLRYLPRLCVAALIEGARELGFSEVRIYRAHCDMFYHAPYLPSLSGEAYATAVKEIRQRMRRRYDGTARQLGFTMQKDWGELHI